MSAPRRLIPLVIAFAAILLGSVAVAQEDEAPPPPPPESPPPVVKIVAYKPPRPRPRLHLQVSGNGGYLYLLGQSFGGGALDVRIGGANRLVTLAFRMNGLAGVSAGGLSFERALAGFQVQVRLHERAHFGLSFLNGIFVYQRAFATSDRDVYGGALALLADVDVELVRSRDAGALAFTTSLGWEFVDSGNARDGGGFSGQLGLAWRY